VLNRFMIPRPQYFQAAIFALDDRIEVLWDAIHLLVVLVEEEFQACEIVHVN
jgi:hypothetical protein